MKKLNYFYLVIFIILNGESIIAQNKDFEVVEADSSTYYNNFFIHGWLLFHKQYHRKENFTLIDSIQFFNTPDTIELDSRYITKTHLSTDKSIDRIEYVIYDGSDSLIFKFEYIPYFKSDTLIRFNVYYFDTINFFADWYYTKGNKLLSRDVTLSLTKDTLDDQEYFIIGNKPYKYRWTHFNELTKVGYRQYEEAYYYKGDYIDYTIRNVFDDNQSILMSYKDI